MKARLFPPAIAALLLVGAVEPALAAKIGELGETSLGAQAWRFFTFQDAAVRYALAGSMLLGVCCGLLLVGLLAEKGAPGRRRVGRGRGGMGCRLVGERCGFCRFGWCWEERLAALPGGAESLPGHGR